MTREELGSKIDWLIEAWCARKELGPLRRILNGSVAINGLTDGWAELLKQLQTIRAQDKGHLTETELNVVIELQHLMDSYVHRRPGP